MRILQICNKLPYPPTDGGAIAMNNVTQGLLEKGVSVKVFAIRTPKSFEIAKIPASYISQTEFESSFIDTTIRPLSALVNLFSGHSYNLERFNDEAAKRDLERILKNGQFDVVQLESLFVTPFIPVIRRFSKARIVLRAHNIEHKIWERLASSSSFPKKQYLDLMASRLKKEEKEAMEQVDGIATITHLDEQLLNQLGIRTKATTIPFGLAVKKIQAHPSSGNRIFHLGSMDWMPNLEGVNWFLAAVLPKLQSSGTAFKLFLAGKKMPAEILNRNSSDCIVESEVADGQDYIANKDIMIVPLLSGGGMRIKIIEGMALGKAIVSTSLGAEGIPYSNGKNILIADTPEEFSKAIQDCITKPALCRQLGENARKLAEECYDNSVITEKLLNFYIDLER